MFVREKKSKDQISSAIQIVENCRVGSTTKQKVIRHVGTGHTKESIDQLKLLAEVMRRQLEDAVISKQENVIGQFGAQVGKLKIISKQTLVNITNLVEKKRSVVGIHDVYGYIYNQLGFTNLFTRPHRREEAAKILREIVLARIARPLSKRASVGMLEEQFGVSIDLDHTYKMMDKMDDKFYERIQQRALASTLKLTGNKLRVLFYDATTLYFESFIEDELKQNGYSKDMKFNQSQVLLALFVTEKGLPVGYELFPGSTFEGHTLIPVIEKLKERYELEDVIFVADRGLLSEENLALLEEKQIKYIVGARIKNMSSKIQSEILNQSNYRVMSVKLNQKKSKKGLVQRIAQFEVKKERRLIVHYNSERAKKDEYDRNRSIEKLYKKLSKSKDPKSLLNNYGYKKYITVSGNAKLSVDESKIGGAAQWDGLLGIVTNIQEGNPEKLLTHYRGLWQIEECFRINKHDLRMRPIYHWSPHRVKAHVAISFIAFVCVRYLEYLISVRSVKISPEEIRKSLLQVQTSILADKLSGKQFLLASAIPKSASKIYKVIGVKIPPGTTEICGALS